MIGAPIQCRRHAVPGFTLIEVLVYVAIVAMITVVIVPYVISLGELFAQYHAKRQVLTSGMTASEHIVRNIQSAASIEAVDTTPPSVAVGTLALTTGSGTVVHFSVTAGGRLELFHNDVSQGFLTDEDVTVTEFRVFTYNAATSDMVRVVLRLEATSGGITVDRRFAASAVMRNTYD